jgi:hypothetical protein
MSQMPLDENRLEPPTGTGAGNGARYAFWISGVGGFVLGALTVIIVLLLTRRMGTGDEVGREARPAPTAVQGDSAK